MHTKERVDLSWLAGYLEGEGCFSAYGGYPCVKVQATDKDVVGKAALLMDTILHTVPRPTVAGKPVYSAAVTGDRAALLMRDLYPFMGIRRQAKIVECIDKDAKRPRVRTGTRCHQAKLTVESVAEIRRLTATPQYGLQSRLARRFGVSQAAIWAVANNLTWVDATLKKEV